MLAQLIQEIRSGGTLQPTALAARLNVSVGLVEMMLEDLERRGLIAQVASGCDEPCGGCPLVGECAIKNPKGRMWMLVQKSAGAETRR